MSYTWILVAESCRAKLYTADHRTAPLVEIEDLVYPEARMHEGDLVSDHAGSDGGSVGQGRHVMDDKTSARKAEKEAFARLLAQRLETGRIEHAYQHLVLIAPPEFLGLLRDNLSKQVMDMVTEQIDKHLVQQPANIVREHLSMSG